MKSAAPPAPPPRRTLLFVPGDDSHKIGKAATSGADAVVIDLEDGVAANRKETARSVVSESISRLDFGGSARLVRINPVGSGLESADLQALAGSPPDGYVIPKIESADQLRNVARATASAPRPLLALIESARGVMNLGEIAAFGEPLEALLFGAEDLAGDLGASRTAEGTEAQWARGAVVVAAAAFSLQAIDTVFVDLGDEAGLRRESRLAATMGYSGKMAIHPKQIPAITEAFTPTAEEIERARLLVEIHARHQASGTGVFVHEGKMVDWPMIRAARRLLARAGAAGKIA